jgi:putative SOS response-associated peptidase YedK
MCGRYVSPDEASIEREFNPVHAEWQFPPCYNVAPTQQVPVVRGIDGARQRLRFAIRRDDYAVWLNGSIDEARGVLRQYDADLMVAYEVTPMVNSPKNNSAELLEPVTPG